jgi:hypothetical protein
MWPMCIDPQGEIEMATTTARWLGWSSVQGILIGSAIFAMGSPAGFSVCGLSWKFPWFVDPSAASSDAHPLAAIGGKSASLSQSPSLPQRSLSADCIWISPTSVMFCVTVRNDERHSIHLHSGHVNLSEVGVANTDWPSMPLPTFEALRIQSAKVQIAADGELPGNPRSFSIDLTVPPGHERRFLLQIDAANLPQWQQNRFFAVGSLVQEDGTAELATPDINLFGQRLTPKPSTATVSTVVNQPIDLSR